METRPIEMGKRWDQAQPLGRRGGNEAVEGGHPRFIQGIEGTSERVIVEMAGLNARGNEARDRLMLEKMGDEIELLMEKAEAVEHHGFDRMAGGHNPHFRVLLRRLIKNLRDTEFFKHPCDQAQVI